MTNPLVSAMRVREAATDMTAPQYRRDSMNDDTPAARVIDAQRREKLATERAERAEAEVARQRGLVAEIGADRKSAGAEWQERVKALDEALCERSEAAWNLEARVARLAKRARRWKRKALKWERSWSVYFPAPADFNAAEAFLHTASAPETPAQPQVEPAATLAADKPEMAVYGQSEPREPTPEYVVLEHGVEWRRDPIYGKWSETKPRPIPLGAWDEPPTLADWPETALDQPGETVRDMGGRA